MTDFVYRPLVWTGPRTPWDQRKSRYIFLAGWGDTVDLLGREIDYLDGTQCVLEADFREGDLRRDGLPRANARRPEFPGVKVSFNTPRLGRLEYATDAYELWQHNVRAIALSLEALRAVDRYGTTSGRQQYTGFRALGAGPTAMPAAAPMGPVDAREFIRLHSGMGLRGDDRDRYRAAARRLHPDAGGSTADFQRLQEAKRVLDIA